MLSSSLTFVKKNIFFVLSVFITVFMMGFTINKAFTQAIVHDEGFSYQIFAQKTWYDIALDHENFGPNSHITNTISLKILDSVPFKDEGVLRLHILFSFFLYTVFSVWLCFRFIPHKFFSFLGVLLLLTNSFLIDYFSIARGYALVIGLMMPAITGLLYLLFTPAYKAFSWIEIGVVLSLSLAAVSNFSFMIIYLILLGLLVLRHAIAVYFEEYKDKKITIQSLFATCATFIRRTSFAWMSGLITLLLSYRMIIVSTVAGQYYVGGTLGFWIDTIPSIIIKSLTGWYEGNLGQFSVQISGIIRWFFLFLFVFSVTYLCYSWYKTFIQKKEMISIPLELKTFITIAVIFFWVEVGTTLLFRLGDIRYLFERTATPIIPIFFLFLIFGLSSVYAAIPQKVKRGKILWLGISIIIGVVFLFGNIITLRPHVTKDFWYDENNTEIFAYLKNEHSSLGRQIRIGGTWLMFNGLNPYVVYYQYDWVYEKYYTVFSWASTPDSLTPEMVCNLDFLVLTSQETSLANSLKPFIIETKVFNPSGIHVYTLDIEKVWVECPSLRSEI